MILLITHSLLTMDKFGVVKAPPMSIISRLLSFVFRMPHLMLQHSLIHACVLCTLYSTRISRIRKIAESGQAQMWSKRKKHIILQNETKNINSLATSYDLARAGDITNFLFPAGFMHCVAVHSVYLLFEYAVIGSHIERISLSLTSHVLVFLFARSVRCRCCRFLWSAVLISSRMCFVALLCYSMLLPAVTTLYSHFACVQIIFYLFLSQNGKRTLHLGLSNHTHTH